MENEINNIINSAIELKKQNISRYEISKYVHKELAKYITYDNQYSSKLDENNQDTVISTERKNKLKLEPTNINSSELICKGMSDIYAYTLNSVGIQAKSIGLYEKGELNQAPVEEANHYCTLINIDNKYYVQDYLVEQSLTRLKIGETKDAGFFPAEEYKSHVENTLMKTNMNKEYIQNFLGIANVEELNDNNLFEIIFNKLFEIFNSNDIKFGFEEAKDFILICSKYFLKERSNVDFINIVKEDESSFELGTIYLIDDQMYLLTNNNALMVDSNYVNDLIEQGFDGRSNNDRIKLENSINKLR